VQGDTGGRTDPASLDRDKGPNILDQRHTLAASVVAQPQFAAQGVAGRILNNNQFGIVLLVASGIPVTIRSNRELNNDAIGSDRPNGVTRNSMNLPARRNLDLRYSRLFPVAGSTKGEFIAELKNVFNTIQWSGANTVVTTDAAGNALAPIPTDVKTGFAPTGGYEQRQLQLGFRVTF